MHGEAPAMTIGKGAMLRTAHVCAIVRKACDGTVSSLVTRYLPLTGICHELRVSQSDHLQRLLKALEGTMSPPGTALLSGLTVHALMMLGQYHICACQRTRLYLLWPNRQSRKANLMLLEAGRLTCQ